MVSANGMVLSSDAQTSQVMESTLSHEDSSRLYAWLSSLIVILLFATLTIMRWFALCGSTPRRVIR